MILIACVMLGSYPGATAAKLRSDCETAKITLKDVTCKLNDAKDVYEKLRSARGCAEGEEEVRISLSPGQTQVITVYTYGRSIDKIYLRSTTPSNRNWIISRSPFRNFRRETLPFTIRRRRTLRP